MTTNTLVNTLAESRMRGLIAAAIIAAGCLAYANTFRNEFVWDDASSIILNEHVKDPGFFFQLFREDQHPFGRGQGNFYRPLLAATFMADYQLAASADPGIPPDPLLFHITSAAWHIAAALLLFALLTRVHAPLLVRAAVPLLYVLHPLHTEAVAYISGRADSMSAAFMFAGLWLAVWESTPAKRITGIILSALCFCAALMSKESSTMFPILLALIIIAAPHAEPSRLAMYKRRAVPFFLSIAILGIYIGLRMTVLKFAATVPPATTFGGRLLEMFQALALYMGLLFMPLDLHMERSLAQTSAWLALPGVLCLALLIGLLAHAALRKHYRAVAAAAWFIATWLPISGIFPLNAPMAEHWMYVPMAGFFWLLFEYAHLYARPLWARGVLATAVVGVCLIFLTLTIAQNRAWRDNETIFRGTLARNDKSIRVHYNLAVTYEDIQKNTAGARRHYERVVDLYKEQKIRQKATDRFWDDELEAYLSLGRIYLRAQDYRRAAEHFQVGARIQPDAQHRDLVAENMAGLGQCLMAMGDNQRALELFKKALALQPGLRPEIARAIS